MSKNQQIMDLLKGMLEDIRTSNVADARTGEKYHSNSGRNVVEWKVTPFPDETVEGITYRDASSTYTELPNKYHQQDLIIEIEIVAAASGGLTPEKLRLLHEDLNHAIKKNPLFFTADKKQLAIRTVPVSVDTIINQESKVVGGKLLKYKVTYAAEEWEI
jgi:hypothetical protein